MGLPAEVRNFFTNRINAVIEAKEELIRKSFDGAEIQRAALIRMCDKLGISMTDIARFEDIDKERDALDKEQEKLRNKIRHTAENNEVSLSYYKDIVSVLRSSALSAYEKEIMTERYPLGCAELAKLQTIKEDVYAVVLLATTEPKLVKALSAVLNKYGGDISELLALIPEQE